MVFVAHKGLFLFRAYGQGRHLLQKLFASLDNLCNLILLELNQRTIIDFLPVVEKPVIMLSPFSRYLPGAHIVAVQG